MGRVLHLNQFYFSLGFWIYQKYNLMTKVNLRTIHKWFWRNYFYSSVEIRHVSRRIFLHRDHFLTTTILCHGKFKKSQTLLWNVTSVYQKKTMATFKWFQNLYIQSYIHIKTQVMPNIWANNLFSKAKQKKNRLFSQKAPMLNRVINTYLKSSWVGQVRIQIYINQ